MLSSRRKTKTRGGSNASARVEQLSSTKCNSENPLRYPDPVKSVMTNSFRNRNLGVSYKIMSGGGKSQSNNWFVSYFLPEIVQHVEDGKSPSKIVQEMMKLWNKNHSKEYRITKKVATQMLYDFADANRKHKGGDVVIPLRWVTNKSSKKVKQTGGNSNPVDNSVNTNESCPVTQSTLPYDNDNYWRLRENSSNASIPRNLFQRTDDWFNGKTTIFTPSHDDITNHSGVKYQCNSSDCSGSTMPKLDNELVSIRDPLNELSGSSSFKLFAENQSGNTSPNQYLLPLSRAGSRRRHKSKKRTRK